MLSAQSLQTFAAELSDAQRAQIDTLTSSIALFDPRESMASSYALSYERFSAFIEQTLEVYRQELVALLFPLFVHSYLSLIVQVHVPSKNPT